MAFSSCMPIRAESWASWFCIKCIIRICSKKNITEEASGQKDAGLSTDSLKVSKVRRAGNKETSLEANKAVLLRMCVIAKAWVRKSHPSLSCWLRGRWYNYFPLPFCRRLHVIAYFYFLNWQRTRVASKRGRHLHLWQWSAKWSGPEIASLLNLCSLSLSF